MDTVRIIEVIETTLLRRGNGTTDPIRVITQYWSMAGELLAEVDPATAEPSKPAPAYERSCPVSRCVLGIDHDGDHERSDGHTWPRFQRSA